MKPLLGDIRIESAWPSIAISKAGTLQLYPRALIQELFCSLGDKRNEKPQ
jgi:hypothetical protein